MDVTLQLQFPHLNNQEYKVSILVLMDVTLQPQALSYNHIVFSVSILVLMDVTLQQSLGLSTKRILVMFQSLF